MIINDYFWKANIKDVIKFKIKWIVKIIKCVFKILWLCVNYPFDKLLKLL